MTWRRVALIVLLALAASANWVDGVSRLFN
jgi:hypothetical protein